MVKAGAHYGALLTIGALIIRVRFGDIIYHNYNKEPGTLWYGMGVSENRGS